MSAARQVAPAVTLIGMASACLAADGTSAQGPDTLVLTLDSAYAIAEKNNPRYRQAIAALDLNAVETRNAWVNEILPHASVDLLSTAYTGNVSRRARDNFGNPIENPAAEWVHFSNTRQSLGLRWTLQGRNLANALVRQRTQNRQRTARAEAALQGVRFSVRRQFFEVLERRELLAEERALAQESRHDVELSRRLYRLARRSRVDVLDAELEVQNQGLDIQRMAASYEQAKLGLRQILGRDALPPIRLVAVPAPVFDPTWLADDALVEGALGASATVRQADRDLDMARLQVSEQRNAWWPSVDLGFNLARHAQRGEAGAFFDLTFDEELDSSFYVRIGLPFFNDYFRNRAAIQGAEVSLSDSREALRAQRLEVARDVRSALLDLRNEYESLRLALHALDIAREAPRLAREEYRIGTRTFEGLRQSTRAEAAQRRKLIQARYGFVDALLVLEGAVGAPVAVPAPAPTDEVGGAAR